MQTPINVLLTICQQEKQRVAKGPEVKRTSQSNFILM